MAKKLLNITSPLKDTKDDSLKTLLKTLDKDTNSVEQQEHKQLDIQFYSVSNKAVNTAANAADLAINNTTTLSIAKSVDYTISHVADNSVLKDIEKPIENSIGSALLNSAVVTTETTPQIKVRRRSILKLKDKPEKEIFLSKAVQGMAEEHTIAEQRVYEVMYLETIAHKRNSGYFSWTFLSKLVKLKNERTIRTAIEGLISKKSIEMVGDKSAGRLGTRYRIYAPREITIRRKQANIIIDPRSKRILD